jgi:hypothetical protein
MGGGEGKLVASEQSRKLVTCTRIRAIAEACGGEAFGIRSIGIPLNPKPFSRDSLQKSTDSIVGSDSVRSNPPLPPGA